MDPRRRWLLLLLFAWLLAGGCKSPVRQRVDSAVAQMAFRPYDVAPQPAPQSPALPPPPVATDTASSNPTPATNLTPATNPVSVMNPAPATNPAPAPPEVRTDSQTAAWIAPTGSPAGPGAPLRDGAVRQVAWTLTAPGAGPQGGSPRKLDLNIPPGLPGSEAPRVELPRDNAKIDREIDRIYPELPPLPLEPPALPGPDGRPYTLSDLQRLAAANNPTLRQAAADVESARGALVQAKAYPNPGSGYLFDPSNDNSTAGVQGVFVDQPVVTGGKLKLGVASAQKDLDNAELAMRRARNDLATAVRNAYFTLLVDKETLVVTRSLARFTDDIYRMQTGLLRGTLAAPYEPASLRAQAFTTRLAYKQAIASYMYDWKQLVATIGLTQAPLTEVSGEVDKFIPYYDFDQVLAYVLQNHTDVLTARNLVPQARYNLKLAQVMGAVPDVDVRATFEKDYVVAPFGTYSMLTVGLPLPLWNRNQGNIMSAQAALIHAAEESHRVEVTLTNNLSAAYGAYQNNLYAVEFYRRYILPDLVRYYRGIYARRQVDPNSSFGDLVNAQQNLSTNVNAYLVVLQSLWTSVVSVADLLQTDDLFQLATPRQLPEMPDGIGELPMPPGGPLAMSAGGQTTLAAASAPGAAPGALPSGVAPAAYVAAPQPSGGLELQPPGGAGPVLQAAYPPAGIAAPAGAAQPLNPGFGPSAAPQQTPAQPWSAPSPIAPATSSPSGRPAWSGRRRPAQGRRRGRPARRGHAARAELEPIREPSGPPSPRAGIIPILRSPRTSASSVEPSKMGLSPSPRRFSDRLLADEQKGGGS